MGKDPAFLFYPGDYLGGTMGFTLEMHGAYLLALLLQFNSGSFSENQIKNIVGEVWHSISFKFQKKENLYFNDRLKEEIIKRKKYSDSRRKNILKRYNKSDKPLSGKKINNLHMKVHKNLHMENENRNENRDINRDENRKLKFINEVNIYEQYPVEMLNKFISYWTEFNKSKTKMRFEMEKTWETSKRLATWASRSKEFNNKFGNQRPSMDELRDQAQRINLS